MKIVTSDKTIRDLTTYLAPLYFTGRIQLRGECAGLARWRTSPNHLARLQYG